MARSRDTPNTTAPETDDVQQSLELLDRVLLEFEDPNSGPSSRIHDVPEEAVEAPPPPEEAARLISALMPRGSPRSSPGQSLRRSPPDPGGSLTSPSQATAATQTTLPKASRHHGSKKLSSRFGSLPFDLSSHAAPQSPPAWLQVLENRTQRDCAAGSSSNANVIGDRNLLHLPIQNPLTTSLSQGPNSGSSGSDVEDDEEQFSDDSLEGQVSSSDREADLRDVASTTSHECAAETEVEEGEAGRQRGSIAWDIPLDWDLDLAACEASASKKRRKDKPPGGVSRSQPQTPSCPPPTLPTSISGGGTYVIRERKKRPALEDAFYCPVIPTSATYTCGLSHVSQYKPQLKNKKEAKISKGKSLPSLHTYKQPSRLHVPETNQPTEQNHVDISNNTSTQEVSNVPCNNVESNIKQEEEEEERIEDEPSTAAVVPTTPIAPVAPMALAVVPIVSLIPRASTSGTKSSQQKEKEIDTSINNTVQEMSFKIMRPRKIRPHSMPPSEGDVVVFKSTVQLESSAINNMDKNKKMRPISMPLNENDTEGIKNSEEECSSANSNKEPCANGFDVCNISIVNGTGSNSAKDIPCEPEPDYSDSEDTPKLPQNIIKIRPKSMCVPVNTLEEVQVKPRPISCSHLFATETILPMCEKSPSVFMKSTEDVEEKIDALLAQSAADCKSASEVPVLALPSPPTEEIHEVMVNGDIEPEEIKETVAIKETEECKKSEMEKIKFIAVPAKVIEQFEENDIKINDDLPIEKTEIKLENTPQAQNSVVITNGENVEIKCTEAAKVMVNGDKTDDMKTEAVLTLSTEVSPVDKKSVSNDDKYMENQTLPYSEPQATNVPVDVPKPSDLPPPPTEDELEFRSEMEDELGTVRSSLVQTDISVLGKKQHKLCLDSPGEEQVVPSLSFRTNVLLTPDEPPRNLVVLGNIDLDEKVTINGRSNMLEPEKKYECTMDEDESLTITTVIIESKEDKKDDDFIPIKRPADLFTSKLETKLSRDSQRRKSHGSTLEMTTRAQENRRSAPECSFLFPQGYNTIPLSFAVTNKPPSRQKDIKERPPVPLPETPVAEKPVPPPHAPPHAVPLEPTYKSIRKEKKANGVAKRQPQPPPLPPHQNLSPPEDDYAEPRKIPDFSSTARNKHHKPSRPRNLHKDDKAPPPPPHKTEVFEEKPLPPTPLTPVQNTKLSIIEDFDSHPLPPSPGSPKPLQRPLPTSATFPVPPSPASLHRNSPHGGRRRLTPPHPLPPSPGDEIDSGRPRRPLPSPPESDYGFTREAREGLGSLKTRSVDAGLGRGLREQLQTSISQAREVGSDRRTLPTELSGATPRRHAGQQYNTGLRSGKKKARAPTVPPHASLPETPVFTRGCDIPRGPYRPPAVGIPVLRSSLSEEGDRLVLCGPARGWYPKQRQNKSARSTENLDQASSLWGEPRKPQTLPPNLNPPKFFHRSPREALRRVTSLLIRRGNSSSKEPRPSKDVVSPNGASGSAQCETPQRQKRSFFRNFWKKSKHYSLEQ